MSSPIARLFTDHPSGVGESYIQHMGVAAGFAFWLAVAAGAACLHAIVPAMCEKTASRIISRLHSRMSTRR